MADKLDYEVVNDKSIDAIKDNFTPPGAKGEKKMKNNLEKEISNIKEMSYRGMKNALKEAKTKYPKEDYNFIEKNIREYTNNSPYVFEGEDWVGDIPFDEVAKRELSKIDTNDNTKDEDDDELYDQMESMGDLPSDMQIQRDLKADKRKKRFLLDKDEMADFQKSLDDYAAKNKKGRDDIPVTTRR